MVEHVDLKQLGRVFKRLIAQSIPEEWVIREGTCLGDVRALRRTQNERIMNFLAVVDFSTRPKMGSTQRTSALKDPSDQNKTYIRVVVFISDGLLAKLSR